MKNTDWAYLAALIDGEGCISINKVKGRYFQLSVRIAQANKPYLEYWQRKTGLGQVYLMRRANQNESNCWQWVMSSKHAESVLRGVLPYLSLKNNEVELALEFRQTKKRQEVLFAGRGKPRLTKQMIDIREDYRTTLQDIKKGRYGAGEITPIIEIDYIDPQMPLFPAD